MAELDKTVRSQKEAKEAELAKRVREVQFQELEAKISADFELLKSRIPSDEKKNEEHAKDMKYLKERQECLEKKW